EAYRVRRSDDNCASERPAGLCARGDPHHAEHQRLMDAAELRVRRATYQRFVELGRAPWAAEIAEAIGSDEGAVRAAWRRLHDTHALVLDETGDIRMLNPFAARPTDFRVDAGGRS